MKHKKKVRHVNQSSASHWNFTCSNCGTGLQRDSHFCSQCGQDTHINKLPFSHFVVEFLEGLFHFDTKIWVTLRKLFKNPGIVIRDYNENKRARYVPPIRLYIFVSVLFFLLAGSGVNKEAENVTTILKNSSLHEGFSISIFSRTKIDSTTATILFSTPHITEKEVDSILSSKNIKSSKLNTKILESFIHFKRGEVSTQEVAHNFITSINKLLFILMPLFAFLVWLIVNPKKLFYTETLVFSIYFHSFYFLLMTGAVLANKLFYFPNLYVFVYIVACFYTLTSIKVAFDKTWIRATWMSLLLITVYTIIFSLIFIFSIITSIIT